MELGMQYLSTALGKQKVQCYAYVKCDADLAIGR
jgi:hypothetical protein